MKPKYLIIAITVLLAVFVLIWLANRGKVKGKIILGYTFYRHKDSAGNDIDYLPQLSGNISALKNACNNNPNCIAFNTAGYLKNAVNPNNFKEYSGYPDWAGIYVKSKALK